MNVGICTLDLYIYNVNSLKEKRSVIKSLINKSKNKFNISIAETGENDKWQKSIVSFACLSNDKKVIDSTKETLIKFILSNYDLEILNIESEIL
ncbi:DUF503 domain-containing protein [Peptoniphilus raoultii]|uniref:DUF503 domain-containing protein n=1 Tax=Peptoniphilus raoultii TaxID=1776387 RepID=UPI0008DAAAE6|nr:DUF503 domain-containing protein [Peptoniphilus raoultii]